MLTKNDLQQIRGVVHEETDPIRKELEEQGKILNQHGKILNEHGKILSQHGKLLRSLKKDQSTMLDMLDKEQM